MSAHAILSPSAAHRWLNCTPAPRLEAELPESASRYAEEGTLAHSVSELLARKRFTTMKPSAYNATLKKLKTDPLWDDEMLTTADTYVEHLTARAMEFEHAPYISLEVKVDLSDYVPEAFGTCDCVMIGGDTLIITDYKYGHTDGMGHGGIPVPAEKNPQMMLYALGALKLYRPIYGDKIRRVRFYIDQPRLNSYSAYSRTVDELLTWGETYVKPRADAAFAGLGEYNPGEWCRFCRARAQCRASADTFTALEDFKDALPESPGYTPLLTNAEVGDLLTRGKALLEWYDALKAYALECCLNGGEIPGWKAVEGRSARAWTDQDKALEAIINAGYPRELVYDMVPKSLAQLEKAIGKPFEEITAGLIIKPIGKPALAPESDKRPTYSGAAADFAGVGDG